jgi:hypothetical protein
MKSAIGKWRLRVEKWWLGEGGYEERDWEMAVAG